MCIRDSVRADQFPAVGRNAPDFEARCAVAKDDAMSARHGPVAVKLYCDGAQQVRAAICHQRSMDISVNQRGNCRFALRLCHAADGITAILSPERGNCLRASVHYWDTDIR